MEKQELRKSMKMLRKAMNPEEVRAKSLLISQRVLKSELYQDADLIMAYMPILNEADPSFLIKKALSEGKKVVVPKVLGEAMEFFLYQPEMELKKSAFSVSEPVVEIVPEFSKEIQERGVRRLMLVPGLVFNRNGFRIGYGKGFYDKYLSKETEPITTIGLSYDFQISSELKEEAHDIPLNFVATESEWIEVRNG